MFFQTTADNQGSDNFADRIKEGIKESVNLLGNIGRIQDGITNINRGFGETRERYQEFSRVVSDSVSDITRLGGGVADIADTIEEIGKGARRNVVASKETLLEIFATQKFLGQTVAGIVENFAQIGVDSSMIAENVENSVNYVRGIGLNAITIMSDVSAKMDLMNRFNFQDGVLGLTKMAAQASMLRFDMQKTADFADKVMNPEAAIQTAAAFQRLGVASGDLIDPFVLMDKSINDPQGLQDSLIDLTRQFTYFDEQAQQFRINPGGVRLMKELAEAAGMTYSEFSKTAISAADLDRRLSMINFEIEAPEEDKLLIANMAKMGEGGRYFVEIEDKGQVELGQITQEEFGKLRESFEEPKTIEDIQRSQLDTFRQVSNDIIALPLRIGYALAGQTGLVRGIETLRFETDKLAERFLGEQGFGTSQDFREGFEGMGDKLIGDLKSVIAGEMTTTEFQASAMSAIRGNTSLFQEQDRRRGSAATIQTQSKVEVDGDIVIRVEAPTTLSEQQIDSIFSKREVQEKIYQIVSSQADVAIRKSKNTN